MNVALRPQCLDLLSICTGGGGLDLGIELAVPGARSVCMVEREAFAVAQLVSAMEQGLLDPAPVWSDARTFDGRAWRGAVDGLIGGIPCQPHSAAGKRLGAKDERDLWSPTRRIIVHSRPWFVLIENVEGMLTSRPGQVPGAERVWRDLRKLGFEVEGGLFTAAEVGASHERERVFILGVRDMGDTASKGSHAAAFAGARSRDEGGRPRHAQPQRRGGHLGASKMADASGGRQLWGQKSDFGAIQSGQPTPRRRDAERCDRPLVDAYAGASEIGEGDATVRRGWTEQPAGDRATGGSADEHTLGNAIGCGHDGRENDALGRSVERASVEGAVGYPLFPPPPNALSSWASVLASAPELEPAFRRVADGLASRLDVARVDRLRMLGNGVVPLQAAHAFRTLCHRLAGRGSAGANRLVRMMGEA